MVNCVSLTQQAGHIAVACSDEVIVYCTETKAITYRAKLDARVKAVELSADAERVVYAGWSKTAWVVELQHGAEMCTFDWSYRGLVKAVSLSPDATNRYLAIAGDMHLASVDSQSGGICGCVTVHQTSHEGTIMEVTRSHEIWAVSLTVRWGRDIMAVAGYDGVVALYQVRRKRAGEKNVPPFCEIREPYNVQPPLRFIWSAQFSADGSKLAVGCWNTKVHVFLTDDMCLAARENADGEHKEDRGVSYPMDLVPIAEPAPRREYTRGDRVYSVALSRSGRKLAVGGRDKMVVVYDTESEETAMLFSVLYDDFVYCVSVSETKVALGGVAKTVKLYDIETGKKEFTSESKDVVWCVALCEQSRYLAIAGADRQAVLHDLSATPAQIVLHFPTPSLIQAVCLSNEGTVAFASGKSASIYGRGTHWSERPGLNFACSLLDKPEALNRILVSHPSVMNYFDAQDNRSFITELCANGSSEVVHMVLKHSTDRQLALRLVPERQLHALLSLASRINDRNLLKLILQVCMTCPPRMRGLVSACLVELCKPDNYPELAMELLGGLSLEDTPFTFQHRVNNSGSPSRARSYFINGMDICSSDHHLDRAPLRTQPKNLMDKVVFLVFPQVWRCSVKCVANLRGCTTKAGWARTANDREATPSWQTALPLSRESSAYCDVKQVFLPGLCTLESLTVMAHSQQLNIFDNETMKAVLQAAWAFVGRPWYVRHSIGKVGMLLVTVGYSFLLSNEASDWADFDDSTNMTTDPSYVGRLLTDGQRRFLAAKAAGKGGGSASISTAAGFSDETFSTTLPQQDLGALWDYSALSKLTMLMDGVIILFYFSVIGKLAVEALGGRSKLTKLRALAGNTRCSGFFQNIVNTIFPLLSLITSVMHLLRLKRAYSVASVASLFVWYRSLFVLRALPQTGPLVHMMEHIAIAMSSFLVVVVIVLAGFAHAFWLLFAFVPDPVDDDGGGLNRGSFSSFGNSFFTMVKMMLGDINTQEFAMAGYDEDLVKWIFTLNMIVVCVVLLNLLIAVVSDKYEPVLQNSHAEFLKNRAGMIMHAFDEMSEQERQRVYRMTKWVQVTLPRSGEMDRRSNVVKSHQELQDHIDLSLEKFEDRFQARALASQRVLQRRQDEEHNNTQASIQAVMSTQEHLEVMSRAIQRRQEEEFSSTQANIKKLEATTMEMHALLRQVASVCASGGPGSRGIAGQAQVQTGNNGTATEE